jgi:hypothetical protein
LHDDLLRDRASLAVAVIACCAESYEQRQPGQHQRSYWFPITILIQLSACSFFMPYRNQAYLFQY